MSGAVQTNQIDPRDHKKYYIHETLFRRAAIPMLKLVFAPFINRIVKGEKNLPDSGPVIVAANHLSNYDVFPLQFALSRPIFYMGKEQLFRNPIMDSLLRWLGAFPVYRGANDQWALNHALKVLENGKVLGMFPEGTRNRGEGLRTAKTGAARLAQSIDCPIVPVALHGPQYMFQRFPKRTQVTIAIGEPIFPISGETHLGLTDRMMFALAEMLPPESRGVYRYHPEGF